MLSTVNLKEVDSSARQDLFHLHWKKTHAFKKTKLNSTVVKIMIQAATEVSTRIIMHFSKEQLLLQMLLVLIIWHPYFRHNKTVYFETNWLQTQREFSAKKTLLNPTQSIQTVDNLQIVAQSELSVAWVKDLTKEIQQVKNKPWLKVALQALTSQPWRQA